MSEHEGFRTGFRGFARQDVLTYIEELRLSHHEEQEFSARRIAELEQQLEEARAQLADAPQAAQREEALRAERDTAQAAVQSLNEQVASLNRELEEARATIAAGHERKLSEELARTRAEMQTLREREDELNTQLAQTHQAVAALWQEKEALEHKLTAAAAFADRQQAEAAQLKRELSGAAPATETAAEKPMERWLF